MSFGSVGRSGGRQGARITGNQYGGLTVELAPSDKRSVRTDDFIKAWRDEIRPLPNVEQINLNARSGGPPGREIDIRLRGGPADALKAAANFGRPVIVMAIIPFGFVGTVLGHLALGFDITIGTCIHDST